MKDTNIIKISIGRGSKGGFVYFVNSKFHKNPQPVNHYDISSVLYRLAKRIIKEKTG